MEKLNWHYLERERDLRARFIQASTVEQHRLIRSELFWVSFRYHYYLAYGPMGQIYVSVGRAVADGIIGKHNDIHKETNPDPRK